MEEITGARVLAVFGDSITTDHISPAGNIKASSPGGIYLSERQVAQKDFNSYGSRRGNFELMERGTFANIRIRNEMMGGAEGGNTIYYAKPDAPGETMSIFDAAQRYKKDGHGTVVFGGKEYGTGSSRDWAAKGPKLQGVRAVVTESFERIHRSNLIGMGVAPFCFEAGKTRKDYGITGREVVDIPGLPGTLKPRQKMEATVHRPDGSSFKLPLYLMILTADEVAYFKNGGILPYVESLAATQNLSGRAALLILEEPVFLKTSQPPGCAFDALFDSLDMLAALALFTRLHRRLAAGRAAAPPPVFICGLPPCCSPPWARSRLWGLPISRFVSAALGASLMVSACAQFARPLPAFAASLAWWPLAGGWPALLSGMPLFALVPALLAGLAVIAAALNSVAAVPVLAGACLLASGLVLLEHSARAGLSLFCAAALVGLKRPHGKEPKPLLIRKSAPAVRAAAPRGAALP